jgi:hypothetical protein
MQESLDRWIDGRGKGDLSPGEEGEREGWRGRGGQIEIGKTGRQISNPRRRSTGRQTHRTNPSKRGLDPLGELSKQPFHRADLRWRQGSSSTSGVGEAEAEMMANRLTSVACRITKPSQSAFLEDIFLKEWLFYMKLFMS